MNILDLEIGAELYCKNIGRCNLTAFHKTNPDRIYVKDTKGRVWCTRSRTILDLSKRGG